MVTVVKHSWYFFLVNLQEPKNKDANEEMMSADEIVSVFLSSGNTSGSEYVPSSDGSDANTLPVEPDSSCEVETKSQSSVNEDGRSDTTVNVKKYTKHKGGKRMWNKKNFCVYCGEGQTKLARHLERKHSK